MLLLVVILFVVVALVDGQQQCGQIPYGILPHLQALNQVHMGQLLFQLQDLQASFPEQPGIKALSNYYDHLVGYRSQAPPLYPPMQPDAAGTNKEAKFKLVPNIDPECKPKEAHYYRTLTGKCNWIANAKYGLSGQGFQRARPSTYADGYNSPRAPPTPQATPRNLSNAFFNPDLKGPVRYWEHSSWLSALVEFIVGDLFGPTNAYPDTPENTWDIPIPKGDPQFDPNGTGTQAFKFTRHEKVPGTGIPGVPREIVNTRTPWFDLDPIYGINEHDNKLLRSGVDGKMKLGADGLLPRVSELGGTLSFKMYGKDPKNLFASGDPRANRDAFLITFITVFVKEHNRLCDVLKDKYPNGISDGPWTDDLLFNTARAILCVKYSTIAMNYFEAYFMEAPSAQYGGIGFNPLVFIQETNEQSQVRVNPYFLYPPDLSFGTGPPFNINNPPTVPLIETDVAYRYHDIVPPVVPLVCENGFRCGERNITEASYNADMYTSYGIDNVLRGMSTNPCPDFGTGLNEQLRSAKWDLADPKVKTYFDLATWSIERERSNGCPTWNQMFGVNQTTGQNLWKGNPPYDLSPKVNWEDFSDDPVMINLLQQYYENVDQVDMSVAMELERQRWPSTALPKSVFAANIMGLINQGLVDRFSLSAAQSRCLVEEKPWDCHPTNVVEELLWAYVPEWGIRWYDQFWLDEFDINTDGATGLWSIIVKNTNVKCLPLNPLFLESDQNPIMCYNITYFPKPDGREFLVFTTAKGQTRAFFYNASRYGDIVYYRLPPIEAGNTGMAVTQNILLNTPDHVFETFVNSTAFNNRPALPLFEYLYSATLNPQIYGVEPKREYAVVNNFGPTYALQRQVIWERVNPSIPGFLPIFDLIQMNYLKLGFLDKLVGTGPVSIAVPLRTYQTMCAGQMVFGFSWFLDPSKGLLKAIDQQYITLWMTLYMTGMDYNLPPMAWAPSANYTNAQGAQAMAQLTRKVWNEESHPLHLDTILDNLSGWLAALGLAIEDFNLKDLINYLHLFKPAVTHFREGGVSLNQTIVTTIDLVGGNIIPSQYMEFGLWKLSCMPDLQARLFKSLKGHHIDYYFLSTNEDATLLLQFVKELTRWVTLGGGILARAAANDFVLDGHLVSKLDATRANLFVNAAVIGRSSDYWKDANVFDPSRWFVNRSSSHPLWDLVYNTSNYRALEFGTGLRQCAGSYIGFVEIAYAIGELVKTYDFKMASADACKVDPEPLMSPFGGWFDPFAMNVVLEKRPLFGKKSFLQSFKDAETWIHNLKEKTKEKVKKACPFGHKEHTEL